MEKNDGFTFLTYDQVFGPERLAIFKDNYDTKRFMTDFALLLCRREGVLSTDDNKKASWWLKDSVEEKNVIKNIINRDKNVYVVDDYGRPKKEKCNNKGIGARPAFYCPPALRRTSTEEDAEVAEIEYGEYPQTIVKEKGLSSEIESAYQFLKRTVKTADPQRRKLIELFGASSKYPFRKTGKKYTAYNIQEDSDSRSQICSYDEYEYQGKKYIRFAISSDAGKENLEGVKHRGKEKYCWIKVEPIKWLVDKKTNIAVSKQLLFSGVSFNTRKTYDGNFDSTRIKRFMKNFFSKEILPSNKPRLERDIKEPRKDRRARELGSSDKRLASNTEPRRYYFDDSISEKDMIQESMKNNRVVKLTGKFDSDLDSILYQFSSDGVTIDLRNATVESLRGKNGVPPTWYLELKEKCEEEPSKEFILRFEGYPNPTHLPEFQNLPVTTLINEMWELPSNCEIAWTITKTATSGDMTQNEEFSLPGCVDIHIDSDLDNWIKRKQKTVHPAILAYVAYKNYSENAGLTDTIKIEPRRWENASKLLYVTNQLETLNSLLGDETTQDFIKFINENVISMNDVIDQKYKEEDLVIGLSQKFATALNLSVVDDENFEEVRNFMKQLGSKPNELFEILWARGDSERLQRLSELRQADILSGGGHTR